MSDRWLGDGVSHPTDEVGRGRAESFPGSLRGRRRGTQVSGMVDGPF